MWRVLNLVPLMQKLAIEFEARLKEAGLLSVRHFGAGGSSPSLEIEGSDGVRGIALETGECGSVSLYVEHGALTVASGSRADLPRVSLNQQTLVQLLLGYRTIAEVLETRGLTGSPAARWLKALFPEVEGVLWWPDRF